MRSSARFALDGDAGDAGGDFDVTRFFRRRAAHGRGVDPERTQRLPVVRQDGRRPACARADHIGQFLTARPVGMGPHVVDDDWLAPVHRGGAGADVGANLQPVQRGEERFGQARRSAAPKPPAAVVEQDDRRREIDELRLDQQRDFLQDGVERRVERDHLEDFGLPVAQALVELALGDVVRDAHQADHRPVVVAQRRLGGGEPDARSVGRGEALLVVDETLAGPHQRALFVAELGGDSGRVQVGVALADEVAASGEAMQPSDGVVGEHEAAAFVLDPEDLRHEVDQRLHRAEIVELRIPVDGLGEFDVDRRPAAARQRQELRLHSPSVRQFGKLYVRLEAFGAAGKESVERGGAAQRRHAREQLGGADALRDGRLVYAEQCGEAAVGADQPTLGVERRETRCHRIDDARPDRLAAQPLRRLALRSEDRRQRRQRPRPTLLFALRLEARMLQLAAAFVHHRLRSSRLF